MSLLSRYYVKQSIQNRLLEEANIDEEVVDESMHNLYREISNIKENIITVEKNVAVAFNGFFGNMGYSQ